jgi:hypothetical protein
MQLHALSHWVVQDLSSYLQLLSDVTHMPGATTLILGAHYDYCCCLVFLLVCQGSFEIRSAYVCYICVFV